MRQPVPLHLIELASSISTFPFIPRPEVRSVVPYLLETWDYPEVDDLLRRIRLSRQLATLGGCATCGKPITKNRYCSKVCSNKFQRAKAGGYPVPAEEIRQWANSHLQEWNALVETAVNFKNHGLVSTPDWDRLQDGHYYSLQRMPNPWYSEEVGHA